MPVLHEVNIVVIHWSILSFFYCRKKAAEEAALNKVREQRRQERKAARAAKAQLKRAVAEAAALQASKEATLAEQPATSAAGVSAPQPDFQYKNYLVSLLFWSLTLQGPRPSMDSHIHSFYEPYQV